MLKKWKKINYINFREKKRQVFFKFSWLYNRTREKWFVSIPGGLFCFSELCFQNKRQCKRVFVQEMKIRFNCSLTIMVIKYKPTFPELKSIKYGTRLSLLYTIGFYHSNLHSNSFNKDFRLIVSFLLFFFIQ